jgi:formylglycine-generating enzyme required for sulfatase activity
MNTRRVIGALLGVAIGASACATVIGIDDLTIGACKGGVCGPDGSSSGGPDGSSSGGPDGSSSGGPDGSLPDSGCPSQGGPGMVRVGGPLNNFCIDSTEVTIGQYRTFLNATVNDAGPVPSVCAWKTSNAPGVLGADELPQTGVDWCDAYAFCQWAGKHLCGKVVNGKASGSVSVPEISDPSVSAWYIACSAQGQLKYPYGSVLKPGACNVLEKDAGKTLPVRQMTECQGGYPNIYDMLGNASEWFDGPILPLDAGVVDAASQDGGPATDALVVKGGDFNSPEAQVDCRVNGVGARRLTRNVALGFRCCSD